MRIWSYAFECLHNTTVDIPWMNLNRNVNSYGFYYAASQTYKHTHGPKFASVSTGQINQMPQVVAKRGTEIHSGTACPTEPHGSLAPVYAQLLKMLEGVLRVIPCRVWHIYSTNQPQATLHTILKVLIKNLYLFGASAWVFVCVPNAQIASWITWRRHKSAKWLGIWQLATASCNCRIRNASKTRK